MNGILKVFALGTLLSAGSAQAQPESYEGIWQSSGTAPSYFLLHIEGSQVVLLDLASLERTRKTLASAYRGQIVASKPGARVATVRVIAVDPDSQGSAQITLNADETLSMLWCHLQNGGCLAGFRTTIKQVLTTDAVSVQAQWYEGIWQQEGSPATYYSLHVVGDEVVLVDLAGLERTGETLASSYRGPLASTASGAPMASLRAINPRAPFPDSADVVVNADKTLTVSWCSTSNGCVNGSYTTLNKVF